MSNGRGAMYQTKIDQVVRAYLKEHGITAREFADEVGVSNGTIQRIRQGKEMSLDTAFLVACRLGLTLDELYTITH